MRQEQLHLHPDEEFNKEDLEFYDAFLKKYGKCACGNYYEKEKDMPTECRGAFTAIKIAAKD